MYFAWLDSDGRLLHARLVPLQMRQFQLHRASPADARWLTDTLNHHASRFGTRLDLDSDNRMTLRWW